MMPPAPDQSVPWLKPVRALSAEIVPTDRGLAMSDENLGKWSKAIRALSRVQKEKVALQLIVLSQRMRARPEKTAVAVEQLSRLILEALGGGQKAVAAMSKAGLGQQAKMLLSNVDGGSLLGGLAPPRRSPKRRPY
ncbi:MAG: hypothetical protein A2341_04005 [Deltaproteobacteria bacterium RIFOXYB12_FULL_58_9]|nr:MAG: hypothetical protein A2341_04005 [Deltaproteobacteria bacterium RIFOXYB12_FULL_58_9]